MSPKENFFFINEFLGVMEPVVSRYGGFIDKYIGDAIMALFPGTVDQAIEAETGMIRELEAFNSVRSCLNLPPVRVGIGMHTGHMMLGTIGGKERMDTTVIADAVNIASRVESANKQYGTTFLATEATLAQAISPGAIRKRRLGEVAVYGKEQRITIFEIYNSDPASIAERKDQTLHLFNQAVSCFEQGAAADALNKFERLLIMNPDDEAAQRYAALCRKTSAAPAAAQIT
jgi:class 3 adenylate cyclase